MMNELRNLKEAKLAQMDLIREMKTPGNGTPSDDDETQTITKQIKVSIIEKDAMIEELQVLRDEVEDRVKQIEMYQDDLIKIDRAIKRRVDKCQLTEDQLVAGAQKLEQTKRLAQQEAEYRAQRMKEEEEERQRKLRDEQDRQRKEVERLKREKEAKEASQRDIADR